MRFGRTSKAIGVAAVAALALSACASAGGNSSDTESAGGSQTGGSISVAETNAFSSFNSDSAKGNVDINGKIAYMTRGGFYHIDNELNVVGTRNSGLMKRSPTTRSW